jgi:Protein of unknown function (DUF3684)
VTDEPVVKSSGIRRSKQTSSSNAGSNKWTSFELPIGPPSLLPGTLTEIGRFLTASLPFMINLEFDTVAFDSYTILRLRKSLDRPTVVSLLKHLQPAAGAGLMKVYEVKKTNIHIDAERFYGHKFHANRTPASSLEFGQSTLPSRNTMLLWAVEFKVTLDKKSELRSGLEKAMKKTVPNHPKFLLIYVSRSTCHPQEK